MKRSDGWMNIEVGMELKKINGEIIKIKKMTSTMVYVGQKPYIDEVDYYDFIIFKNTLLSSLEDRIYTLIS